MVATSARPARLSWMWIRSVPWSRAQTSWAAPAWADAAAGLPAPAPAAVGTAGVAGTAGTARPGTAHAWAAGSSASSSAASDRTAMRGREAGTITTGIPPGDRRGRRRTAGCGARTLRTCRAIAACTQDKPGEPDVPCVAFAVGRVLLPRKRCRPSRSAVRPPKRSLPRVRFRRSAAADPVGGPAAEALPACRGVRFRGSVHPTVDVVRQPWRRPDAVPCGGAPGRPRR
jgi:hypothetical protein